MSAGSVATPFDDLTPQQTPSSAVATPFDDIVQQQNQTSQPVDTTHTERAMQQTMGGPPMFVDVPSGTKDQFEKAGQEGYQKGGVAGATLVAGAGLVDPVMAAIGAHLGTLKTIANLAKKWGWAGDVGYREARELYKEFSGDSKK